ncbi:hypothetical protein IAD21_00623 [Abditibacteriota bacterium]|nr:hypothetical protein IAD21_00623 [Abditibacteriota bacterium]
MPHSLSPTPIRRRVRVERRTGDEVVFVTKSFTKDDGTQYHPVINGATGEFTCDCPDHLYRHSFCKHLRRAQAQLKRAGISSPPVAPPPPHSIAPVASPLPAPLVPQSSVASAPLAPLLESGLRPLVSPAMPRFFANEHITQIIPAPNWLKAQFADGCSDEPVLCLALLSVPASGKTKAPYQMVMPMVAYHGALELACDIERPYLRLSSESR